LLTFSFVLNKVVKLKILVLPIFINSFVH
jgi:hypothetical protein